MAKSPVYGRGRNRKHRGYQGYGPRPSAAANINMKGKKSRIESCYCCVCIDMRDDLLKKIHTKEMVRGQDGNAADC